MDERSSRIFFGLCMLVLVWIGIYWMWRPGREQSPLITFERDPAVPDEPPPDQEQPAPVVQQRTQPIVQDEPGPDGLPAPPSSPVLVAPEFREHTVLPGELMQTIAKAYYGSIDDWAVIARANPRIDPTKLKPGMILRIPIDKNNIQGRLEGDEAQPGVIRSHDQTPARVIEYVVRPGDSLSVISQRIYGSSRHARFIFESNRGILRSMDAISVGQLLKLPPLPNEETQAEADPDG